MFVGYEVKSNVNAAKPLVLETDIKLSQAVLDPAGKANKKEPVCVMVEHNKKQFILAVLDPSQSWQCPLDLMFAAGSEVKFFLRGSGSVHLTGFECRDEMDDIDMSMSSDDEDVSEDDEEAVPLKERKSKIKALENGVKSNNKKDAGAAIGSKGDQQDSDDDDDEDDEDFNELDDEDDDSDIDVFDEDSSEPDDEEMDDNDTLGQLDVEDSDEDDDEDEESD